MKYILLLTLFICFASLSIGQNKENPIYWQIGDQWELEAYYHSTDCCIPFVWGSIEERPHLSHTYDIRVSVNKDTLIYNKESWCLLFETFVDTSHVNHNQVLSSIMNKEKFEVIIAKENFATLKVNRLGKNSCYRCDVAHFDKENFSFPRYGPKWFPIEILPVWGVSTWEKEKRHIFKRPERCAKLDIRITDIENAIIMDINSNNACQDYDERVSSQFRQIWDHDAKWWRYYERTVCGKKSLIVKLKE